MKKAIIIYGSETGNTKTAARVINEAITGRGAEVVEKSAADASVDETTDYDLVLLGSSTWGEGDIQDDFLLFYDDMDERLKGKRAAVFGCGDSAMFPDCFCEAVDKIQKKAKECGAVIVSQPCRIDGDVSESIDEISTWAKSIEV